MLSNLCMNETSSYSQKIVTVYDPDRLLAKVLGCLIENSSFGEFRLLAELNGTERNCAIGGEVDRIMKKNKTGMIIVYEEVNKEADLLLMAQKA